MKYFKRKARSSDFTIDDLPKTRKKQFLTILKNDYILLLKIGLVLFAFYLPMLIVELIRFNLLNGILQVFTGDEQAAMIELTQLIYGAICCVCFMVFSIGLSGIFYIYKRLIWGKPIFFKEDFKIGIKQNWKAFLLISLIGSVLEYVCFFVVFLNPDNIIFQSITYGINLMVFIPYIAEFFFLNTFYKNKFGKSLLFSGVFYIKNFLFLISFCCLIYIFYFINIIPYIVIAIIVKTVCIITLVPIIILYGFSSHVYKYDCLINEKQYPSIYHRGINY